MNKPVVPLEIRYSLAQATDEQILRVVRTVDTLADRGSADQFVAPLRCRLGHLRPPRPLRFARLLFLPLDPMIVQPSQWRMGGNHIPRSALLPIASAVQAALGGAPAVTALIEGQVVGDTVTEAAAGGLLWPQAGKILAAMAACPDWEVATGLPETAWLDIRPKVAGILLVAARIRGEGAPAFATPGAMEALLDDVQTHAPLAMHAVLSLLLSVGQNLPHVMRAASRHSDRLGALSNTVVLRTLEAMPQTLAAKIGRAHAEDAAAEADRVSVFLAAVEASGHSSRAQLRAARQAAAAQCSDRFARGIGEDVLAPLMARGRSLSDDEMMALEETARALHRIEGAGRILGGGTHLDETLNEAWNTLSALKADSLDPIDRARLAEILFGPDAAEAMLSALTS